MSPKDYLDVIRPFLRDLIDSHKTQGEWKIQWTMAIIFISSKDSNETSIMHTKIDNIDVIIGNETDEIIEKLFKSLLQRYQKNLEESMRGSDFFYDYVDLLYFKFHRIRLNRGGSYIDSPKFLKNKKATINPKNNDDKCFQYAVTAAALNHEQIKKDPQRFQKLSFLLINMIGKR